MIKIKRPFLFGANNGIFTLFIDNKEVCKIDAQSIKEIDLEDGEYQFRVESRIFKSKETKIGVKDGDLLTIKAPKSLWLVVLLPAILFSSYYIFKFSKTYLILGATGIILLSLIYYLPIFKNNYYKIIRK